MASNARNVNVARKELINCINQSQEDDPGTNLYRGLYDKKSNKMWLWFALDGLHQSVVKMLSLNKNDIIHLYYYPKGSGKRVSILAPEIMGDKDKRVFHKFFGKRTPFVLGGGRGLAFGENK